MLQGVPIFISMPVDVDPGNRMWFVARVLYFGGLVTPAGDVSGQAPACEASGNPIRIMVP